MGVRGDHYGMDVWGCVGSYGGMGVHRVVAERWGSVGIIMGGCGGMGPHWGYCGL